MTAAGEVRAALGRRLTERWSADHGVGQVDVRAADPVEGLPHRIAVERSGDRVRVACHDRVLTNSNEAFHRVWAILDLVGGTTEFEGETVAADISDGEEGGAGLIGFCSRDPASILVPDYVFVRTRGYHAQRVLARVSVNDWSARSDTIVWRGTSTGAGLVATPELSAADPALIARTRLCLILKDVPGTDVKLSAVAQTPDTMRDSARLSEARILGDYISPIAWYGLKFAIDIDGNGNAFANLFTRLLMGCCVLKVASAAGYRQWYYGELTPWVHYVPVAADLSDLCDIIGWCRAHPDECRGIARQGQALALTRDFATEMAAARANLAQALREGRLRGPSSRVTG
jgi:hypothetical protein